MTAKMKAKVNITRRACLFAALVLLLSVLLPSPAAADYSGARSISLTAVIKSGGTAVEGVEFKLYHVAEVTSAGAYQVSSTFKGAGVSLSTSATQDSWSSRALTLESYIVKRAAEGSAIDHTVKGTSDENGSVTFSGLDEGLYLLVGTQTTVNGTVYTPLATLVTLPSTGNYNVKDYSPTVNVKFETQSVTPSPTPSESPNPTPTPSVTPTPTEPVTPTIDLAVIKIWKDDGHADSRPSEITVTLYRDGEKYDSVTLSARNSWKHTWTVPDDTSRWQLVEDEVPDGYTVTAVQDGKTFVVTNTYTEPTPTPTPSDTTPQPTSQPSPTPTPSGKLPQTGQLWWPVSILALCGLALVLFGIRIRKSEDNEK
jgi:hypothetical protein